MARSFAPTNAKGSSRSRWRCATVSAPPGIQESEMQRRTFILLAGATAGWAFAAHAQQTALPVVGFIHSSSPEVFRREVAGFRKGLAEAGFTEGRDVEIEYRWAEGHYERLPALATELTRIPAAVIAATGVTAALASQKATSTIPVVFHTGGDPVTFGL